MTPSPPDLVRQVRVGAIAGLATCVIYPAIIFVPWQGEPVVAVVLAAAMGPFLGVASWGMRTFLKLDRPRPSADLAALSNALAGALLTAMFLVQLAAGMRTKRLTREVEAVWLGLDVAWDVYLGLGTLVFALNAYTHPRLGRVVGAAGAVIAMALLVTNLVTFPVPPGNAGLVDIGPLVGIWYLIVTIMTLRSMGWVRARAEALGRRSDASTAP